ncbi:hypothetical protein HHI36_016662 [Cryptolaemus montrouzieri]|uniref:Timeless C-terminal domain-containing protein n=1 Tax=Cryptolaemus montrouzieri TaxID=559131 RepID=A0ABD2NKG7_9CUCU
MSGKICEDSQYSEASSDSDGSDDGVSRRPTMSSNTMGGNTSSKPKHKKTVRKARSVINISSRRLAELALGIMQADMKEALEWLKESFSDAIEDFDDDTDEGIPLVPIMDYAVNAMDNNDFQNFLLGLGISKPFDEQETYWRIPGDMNLETMKSHEGLLTKVLEGTFTLPEEETAATEPVDQEQTNGDSTDDDIFDQLRKMRESNRDDEIDQEENANTEVEQLRKSKSNVLNGRDNDRPSASGVGAESENSDSEDEDIFAKLKRKTLVDSSEAFEDGPTENATRNRKRRRLSSSDEQFDDGGDILAKAEEKLKNEKKKKKLSKKGGKNPNNEAKKKNTDIESKKKENNKSKSKVATNANFKSKEFISSDDDSGDDEESANKVKEHYEKLLQQDVQQNAERKAAKRITDRPESTDNDSDDNDSKEELKNKNTNDIQNDEQKESSEASEEETNYESNE